MSEPHVHGAFVRCARRRLARAPGVLAPLLVLVGCAAIRPAPPGTMPDASREAAPVPEAVAAPSPPPAASAPAARGTAATPATRTQTTGVAAPKPATVPVDVAAAMKQATQSLEAGDAAAAEPIVQQVLRQEPTQAQALSYLRQIREEPAAVLGARESWSYQVQPNDTLSLIAGRFLRDPFLFFALARFNNLPVPRQLMVGQTIRIPGRQPAAAAPPPVPTTPAVAAAAPVGAASSPVAGGSAPREPGGPSAPAVAPSVPLPASSTAPVGVHPATPAAARPPVPPVVAATASEAASAPSRAVAQRIRTHASTAMRCLAAQDPCCAVSQWKKVLELDPENEAARDGRAKAERQIRDARRKGIRMEC